MDSLLAEINNKRKELDSSDAGPSRKYMKRADIEREREAEEKKKRDEARLKKEGADKSRAEKLRAEAEGARKASLARLAGSPGGSGRNTPEPSSSEPREAFNISPEECIRRLRAKGQPIRLFGETDKDRRLRLRALELREERGGGTTNELNTTMADLERRNEEKAARGEVAKKDGGGEGGKKEEERVEVGLIDLELVKTDPNKLYPLIYYALKGILREWEEWMDARPDEVKRSGQGKLASANVAQSAIYLKPLFKQLRGRDMAPEVIRLLAQVIHHCQSRQYQKANDSYLELAIGNSAWPIGVTGTGMHERGSRERLHEKNNVAHVLNDEISRKWIQSLKRLMTFSQTVRPPDDMSQAMG